MLKTNYSKFRGISLWGDIPIKFTHIKRVFDKYNIKTLEDLFIAYDNGFFDDKKGYKDIKGEVELLRAYYLNKPFQVHDILSIRLDFNNKDYLYDSSLYSMFMKIGITSDEYELLVRYLYTRDDFIPLDDKGLIDMVLFLRTFSIDKTYHEVLMDISTKYNDIIYNLLFKINFFIEYFNRQALVKTGLNPRMLDLSKLNSAVEHRVIKSLEDELKYLLKTRKDIDEHIEMLIEQIDAIKKSGSVR